MITLNDFPLRNNLKGQQPYGAPQLQVPVTLNVNENTHPLDENVIEQITAAVKESLSTVNRYPERDFLELRQALAGYLGCNLTAEHIWAANGSNETLQQILQAFGGPGRKFLSFTPSYSMYPLLAQSTDTEWLAIARPADFMLTPEYVSAELREHKPDVVVLCGPNNPTGTSLSLDTVAAAYDSFDGILIVDEAYHEFEDNTASAVTLLEGRHRLVVSRTMSKAFSFAGARVGYLAAHPKLIDALKLVRLPYHLSALTQAAAIVAVKNAKIMMRAVDAIKVQRERLELELKKLGLKPYQSGANFLLVDGFGDNQTAFQALLDRGVLVRVFAIPGHLRLTVGTERENTIMIRAISEYMQNR